MCALKGILIDNNVGREHALQQYSVLLAQHVFEDINISCGYNESEISFEFKADALTHIAGSHVTEKNMFTSLDMCAADELLVLWLAHLVNLITLIKEVLVRTSAAEQD